MSEARLDPPSFFLKPPLPPLSFPTVAAPFCAHAKRGAAEVRELGGRAGGCRQPFGENNAHAGKGKTHVEMGLGVGVGVGGAASRWGWGV